MTIQDLEVGVSHLRPKELKEFRAWFEEFDADEWDKEFEADANSGKLDSLANQALKDFAAGKRTPLCFITQVPNSGLNIIPCQSIFRRLQILATNYLNQILGTLSY